jgi:S-adenosylmethionine-diacylgycerolhomoserine-N-methlytransferase
MYGKGQFRLKEPVDVVLFSYSLSMFNPGCEGAIEQAYDDLKPGGYIAVVDFHDTASNWFRRWMGRHHVRMEGHLLPLLEERFEIKTLEVRRAYGGLWRYFLFVGQKRIVS